MEHKQNSILTDPPEPIPKTPRVLSVQSHVVSGYCGNKSATFPLQLLGLEVDVINTVQFSNHTQYKVVKGQTFKAQDLIELHRGLKENNLIELYDFILTGYIADPLYVRPLGELIDSIKCCKREKKQDCLYVLDPVLGDDGPGYYVPSGKSMVKAYQSYLLEHADVITPNRFEACALTGFEIDCQSDNALRQAIDVINEFHFGYGITTVIITSLEIDSAEGKITCLASTLDPHAEQSGFNQDKLLDGTDAPIGHLWAISVPKLKCPFTGTGDLFTALLLGWLSKAKLYQLVPSSADLKQAVENATNTIQDILDDTMVWYKQVGDDSVQSQELRLVQNRDKILKPSKRFKAGQLFKVNNRELDLSYFSQQEQDKQNNANKNGQKLEDKVGKDNNE